MNEMLFSYGTLQYEAVQMSTFSRKLTGHADAIVGYRLDQVIIDDPYVVKLSGEAIHKMLMPTHDTSDTVPGMVFEITAEELQKADKYEIAAYNRVKVPLLSGNTAWAYVSAKHVKGAL